MSADVAAVVEGVLAEHVTRWSGWSNLAVCTCGTGPYGLADHRAHVAATIAQAVAARDEGEAVERAAVLAELGVCPFKENVRDGSMCVCGLPALNHDEVAASSAPSAHAAAAASSPTTATATRWTAHDHPPARRPHRHPRLRHPHPPRLQGRQLPRPRRPRLQRQEAPPLAQDRPRPRPKTSPATTTPITGPVRVWVRFTFTRPPSHYRTGRNAHLVRDAAPTSPAASTATSTSWSARSSTPSPTPASGPTTPRSSTCGPASSTPARTSYALDRPGVDIVVEPLEADVPLTTVPVSEGEAGAGTVQPSRTSTRRTPATSRGPTSCGPHPSAPSGPRPTGRTSPPSRKASSRTPSPTRPPSAPGC
jgi:hypothetical protein